MPEGDTIFRTARTLHRVLAGRIVTQFDSVYPAVTRVADDHPIVGRTVESVIARGKHLLIHFSGDLVLHTHMRMNGSWHVYPAGARWQRPARDVRVLVGTDQAVAVGFNVPIAELLTGRQLSRHEELRNLGPDVLSDSFDPDEAVRRLRAHALRFAGGCPERESKEGGGTIADALLNQRIVAGLGNVFKSETLFLAGVDPFALVASLDDDTLRHVLDLAAETMKSSANVRAGARAGRRTTRSMDPAVDLWVYGRAGKPCRRCGARIESRKTGLDARATYWCPSCQRR